MKKQVDKQHYQFDKYVQKKRWISIWHQINEVMNVGAVNVLEIGPGPGIFKLILNKFNVRVETVDIDPDLNPDYVASATDIPIADGTFDCVCAFQMLEHLPYQDSLKAFGEMVRVSNNYIIISLPNARKISEYRFPLVKEIKFQLPRFIERIEVHQFDGEHYWEINKKGYSLEEVTNDFCNNNVELIESYRVKENPYHHFFVFRKRK